jgi:hypothetical protein
MTTEHLSATSGNVKVTDVRDPHIEGYLVWLINLKECGLSLRYLATAMCNYQEYQATGYAFFRRATWRCIQKSVASLNKHGRN